MSGLPFMSVSSFSVRHLAPRRRVAPPLAANQCSHGAACKLTYCIYLFMVGLYTLRYAPPREGVHNLPPRRAASALRRAVHHSRRRRDVAPDVCSVVLSPVDSAAAASRLSRVIMVRLTPAHRRAEVSFAYNRTTLHSCHCLWPRIAAATVHLYIPACESSDTLRICSPAYACSPYYSSDIHSLSYHTLSLSSHSFILLFCLSCIQSIPFLTYISGGQGRCSYCLEERLNLNVCCASKRRCRRFCC